MSTSTIVKSTTTKRGSNSESNSSIGAKVKQLQDTFKTRKTQDVEWRRTQLKALARMFREETSAIQAAAYDDLHRCELDSYLVDVRGLEVECEEALSNLDAWTEDVPASVTIKNFPSSSFLRPEPLGTVLIIGTWNFPMATTVGVAISAIAAGNCVLMKPSEISPASAKLMAEILPKYLDTDAIAVITGGPEVAQEVLKEQQFDHIFFTGSERIGRLVYQAAALKLTPVTLELGGKSPTVVDDTANLEVTARRVLWAKVMNCGQICIAPDYILVFKSVAPAFYETLQRVYADFFPNGEPADDYGRIVDDRNTGRLLTMLEEKESIRGKILVGGTFKREDKYIVPTVFVGTKPEAKVMQDEIFGPLLPILEVDDLDEAIDFITTRPKPLAAYMFSTNSEAIEKFMDQTTSGNTLINDVVVHCSEPGLPFGGVGASGIGCAHGYFGFKTFSHMKGVLHKSSMSCLDVSIRYPPYNENKAYWTKKII